MRDLARVFVLATIAVGSVLPCRPQPECTRGDMLAKMSPRLREAFQKDEKEHGWMHDVIICKAGRFTILSPASGGEEDRIMVMRGEEGVFTRMTGGSTLYRNGLPAVTLTDADNPADPPTLSYDGRDASGNEVSVFDRNFDGQADFRYRWVRGQKPIHEKWVDDRWVHPIIQNGVSGYLRDGRFVPLEPENSQHGE
jgi:hypothetical protein